MRNFIAFCSSIFVIIGILICAISALLLFTAFNDGEFGGGLAIAAGGVFAGATATLVGGSTYILCNILDLLERSIKQTQTAAHLPSSAAALEIENLPSPGSITPAGSYRRPDGTLFEHPGGPVQKYAETIL